MLALALALVLGADMPGALTADQIQKAKAWVAEMQANYKGPYGGIMWYCNDGTEVVPKEGNCLEHGSGKQYGVLKREAVELGKLGIYAGTILAALEPKSFAENDYYRARAFIVERYLERALDGWTLKKAKTYRGFRQVEDEDEAARLIMIALMGQKTMFDERRSLSIRLIDSMPYGQQGSTASLVRDQAAVLGDLDPMFAPIRFKVHAAPEPSDILSVEAYAKKTKNSDFAKQALELAATLKKHFDASARLERLQNVQKWVRDDATKRHIDTFAKLTGKDTLAIIENGGRLIQTAEAALAETNHPRQGERNLLLLHTMQLVEELWVGVTADLTRMPLTRAQTLAVFSNLISSAKALGYLSQRELINAQASIARMNSGTASEYVAGVGQAERVLSWARARIYADVGMALDRYQAIEPRAENVMDDILRSGVMLPIAVTLDRLAADAESLRGGGHRMVGLGDTPSTAGVRGENAGIAIGKLRIVDTAAKLAALQRDDIAFLQDLPPDLPPVAGVITTGAVGSLSHVAMLARNLGIPLATSGELSAKLRELDGQDLVLGVSAGRRVLIGLASAFSNEEREALLQKRDKQPTTFSIAADKLDLKTSRILPLSEVSEKDSGVRVGPKAGELGHLKRLFPTRVSDAAIIPFGAFVKHVDRPAANGAPSPFARLRYAYSLAQRLPDEEAERYMLSELARFRTAIADLPYPDGFEAEVDAALARLGDIGTFGVFVRSDTNVEDLKDFTGAGLNKTVFNRVSRASILAAIRDVWASPFQDRSYRWRQRLLTNPEFVFPSVVLHKTVPSELSGVLVTTDIETGDEKAITVSISEGAAAVVDGGVPETVVIRNNGDQRFLASNRTVTCKIIPPPPKEDVVLTATSTRDVLLDKAKADEIRQLAKEVEDKMPDNKGIPWDVEFGMIGDKAYLLQIRPLRIAKAAARHPLLAAMDEKAKPATGTLDLTAAIPTG
ncbi:MAG: PEP/pyruvate-binding domain-containing protein [Myxococcota bacterium]